MGFRRWLLLACLVLAPLVVRAGPEPARAFLEADRAFDAGDLPAASRGYEACAAEARSRGDSEALARALEGQAALLLLQGDDGAGYRRGMAEVTSLRRSLAIPAASARSNLVREGGFERGLIPPWGTGHYESGDFNFGAWWNSVSTRSFAKMDGAVTRSGRASLRITNLTKGGPHLFGTTAQRVRAVKPNTLYEISVWARAQDLEPGAVQLVVDPAWHMRPISLPKGTWDWRLFKAQFDSADLSFMDVRILSLSTGTVWLDDLSLRELSQGEQAEDPLLQADDLFRRGFARQALERYRQLVDQQPERAVAIRTRMAEALAALGEYGEAAALYEQVKTPTNWRAWMALGDIYLNLGQPQKALEQFRYVHDRTSQDQATLAFSSDRMATALLRLDRLQDAAAFEGEALGILTHINDPHGRGKALGNLARIHLKAGNTQAARECLESALPLARATGDRKLESDLLQRRAVVLGREKDLPRALADLREAIRLRREILDRYGLIFSLYWQGRFLAQKGDRPAAIASLREAVDLVESVKDGAGSIEQGGETLLQRTSRIYEELIRLLLEEGRTEQALEVLSRSRTEELRRLFEGQQAPLREEDRKVLQAGQDLAGDREALERRIQHELSQPAPQQDQAVVTEARREREKRQAEYRSFLRDLFQTHPELAGLISVHPKQLRLRQATLPVDAAIVEYLCGERQLYLFVVTRSALEVRVLDLPREDLAVRIGNWRRLLVAGASTRAEDPALLEQSHRLYRDLLGPVEPLLKNVRTLAILPNGPLHYLPFQALVTDLRSRRYLVDRMACVNLCEESFLAPPAASGAPRRLLLLGNPDGSLEHAEEEVRSIAALFPGSQAFVGRQARKDLVVSMQPDVQGLHIASHGVLDSADAANSYILLAPESGSAEGGRLTLREIWGLDLEGLDLVTLSACATGLGEDNPGDDLISLENAFLFAGAGSVVASLWDVDDSATAKLMTAFYERLPREERARALQEAQKTVKAELPHPYFWASFILVGPPASTTRSVP